MNFSGDPSNPKSREYLKQQHQLRTMTKTTAKMTADDMIENLLSKKEIFQKKKEVKEASSKSGASMAWPSWLNSGSEPPMYRQVWNQVMAPTGLADTAKVSALLLTSRLSTDTLGFIWNLTNLTVAGSLTQHELYLNLALVALAQNGYTFTNANVVKQLAEGPLPRLDLQRIDLATIPVTGPPPQTLAYQPTVQQVVAPPEKPVSSTSTSLATILPPAGPPGVPTVAETLSLLDLSPEPVTLIDSSPSRTLSVLSVTDLSKDFRDSAPPPPPTDNTLVFGDFQGCSVVEDDEEFVEFQSADFVSAGMSSLTVLDPVEPLPEKPRNDSDKVSEDLFPKCVVKNKSPDLFAPIETFEKPEPPHPSPQPVSIPPAISQVDEDRYSALRMLDSDPTTSQSGDDFGDFLAAEPVPDAPSTATQWSPSSSPAPSFDSSPLGSLNSDIQLKCLEACLETLKEAVSIFDGIEDPKILSEVMSDVRGKSYLEELLEVERIGRRIRSTRESCDLITEFENLSKALQPYIDPVKNNHMTEEDGPKCGICQCDFGPVHVKYGINHFHAPCANLYLHKVDSNLPIAPVM